MVHSIRNEDLLSNAIVGERLSFAEAQRLLGRARSELEFVQPGALLESLEIRLAGLQKTCHDVGEALAVQYFHAVPWVAWSDAGQRDPLSTVRGKT